MSNISLSLQIPIFLLCCVGIVITAFWAIEAIKAVSEKFKLSETFIGAVFLSVGTSFPEFINSIVAGVMDRDYSSEKTKTANESFNSFYNITGANIWQIVFLAATMAILAIYYKFKKSEKEINEINNIFWNESWLSWKLVFAETILLIFVFGFSAIFSYLSLGGFSFLNLIFLGVWIYYITTTYTQKPSDEEEVKNKYFSKCNKSTLIFITLALWSLFGAFSYTNFWISGQFSKKIGEQASFGVILSFITSSPEFSVMYFLFRQKKYKMAVSGFFGSSLFNLTLPFYSNIISMNTIFGSQKFPSNINSQKITIWLMLNVVLLYLFLFTFWQKKRKYEVIAINGTVITAIYAIVSIFLSM